MLQAEITAHGITVIAACGVRGLAQCMAHSVLSMRPNVQRLCTAFGHAAAHGHTEWHHFFIHVQLQLPRPHSVHDSR